jgi:uncharacterized protein
MVFFAALLFAALRFVVLVMCGMIVFFVIPRTSLIGFPLHPAKRPSDERAEHLFDVQVPMLFLQGARDQLADPALLSSVTKRLGERASLHLFRDADHSFHVPARTGRTDADVMSEMLDTLVAWTHSVISRLG